MSLDSKDVSTKGNHVDSVKKYQEVKQKIENSSEKILLEGPVGQSLNGDVRQDKASKSVENTGQSPSVESGTSDYDSKRELVYDSKWEPIAKHNARMAAESAIMGRNMSHNLGSHVLSYAINALSSDDEKKSKLKDENYVRGIAHLLQYLQERQDFIASVATQHVPYFSPVEFKETIFDFINPDKAVWRHGKKPVDNIVLDTIARSEGYCHLTKGLESGEKRQLNVVYYDRENKMVVTGDPDPEKSIDNVRNKPFMLAGGVIGRQAVLSIVENLIRNAAKHENLKGDLNLYLELLSKEDLLSIIDENREDIKTAYRESADKDALDYLVFSYAAKKDSKVIENMHKALIEGFIETSEYKMISDYKMIETNKGIKELRISAAWLRGNFDESEYCQFEISSEGKIIPNGKGKLAPLLWVQYSTIKGKDVLQFIVGVRKLWDLSVIDEGYDNEFLTITNSSEIKHYTTTEEYTKDKFSNCAICTIVSSNEVKDAIAQSSYGRVVVLNTTLFNADENKFIGGNLTKEKLLKIVHARFAGQTLSNLPPIDIHIAGDNGLKTQIKSTVCQEDVIRIESNEIANYQYWYKRHLDGEAARGIFLKKLRNDKYKNLLFAESISGNNSTFRIIVNQKKDEQWHYEQLAAMNCKIAIFDERIYQSKQNDDQALFMKLKGVYCFNIDEEFNVWGYYPGKNYKVNQHHKIGRITVKEDENKELQLHFELESLECSQEEWKFFDYISIHQGLIDKFYDNLFNKSKSRENCVKIMNSIIRHFAKTGDTLNENDYFPRIIVHSGRGNISSENMPLPLPFIPYSSLKYAVDDCKFSLFNLLTYAKHDE